MNCIIIYYSARKTSFCEKALKKAFPDMGLNMISAVFATMRSSLGEELKKAFDTCDVVFTVGGLEFEDNRSVRDIISQASAGSKPSLCRRLSCRRLSCRRFSGSAVCFLIFILITHI